MEEKKRSAQLRCADKMSKKIFIVNGANTAAGWLHLPETMYMPSLFVPMENILNPFSHLVGHVVATYQIMWS